MYNGIKEYVVTLKSYDDLEQFYIDMETEDTSLDFVPSRSVQCFLKKPLSRNTSYLLTDKEAKLLKSDTRVKDITLKFIKFFTKENFAEQQGVWDRSTSISSGYKNWGLLRIQLEENISNWGSGGGNPVQSSTVKINASGKDVDIIIVDDILYPDHPELVGRVVEYDWFRQHDVDVRGDALTIVNVSRTSNVTTVTTLEPHRIRSGHIVDIICTSDNSFNATAVSVSVQEGSGGRILNPNQFTYPNAGPNVLETSATGFWRGVYQYPSYTGDNNHATAVASIIAGATQGWAKGANIYNLRHDALGLRAGEYTPADYLIDYIRAFHNSKPINPVTGKRAPTLVNNSWGFTTNTFFAFNIYTDNPAYSALYFRNSTITPAGTPVDTGVSGACSQTTILGSFPSLADTTAYSIVTPDASTATVTSIVFSNTNGTGLTSLGAPVATSAFGIDANDDAYWDIALPFNISYLGTSRSSIRVISNSVIVFGTPFLNINDLSEFAPNYPAVDKILISAGDRNVDNILTGTFGDPGTRTHVVRFEGWDGAYSSLYEPTYNLIWEAVFYEATPNRVDIRIVKNAAFRTEFTLEELDTYGVPTEIPAPVRVADLDTDIDDAIAEGIIFVGAAGNSSSGFPGSKIDVPGGQDYDNYFVLNGERVYYHRGSSPSRSNIDIITVGALSSSVEERKRSESNAGPGVDLYAPGENIVSAVFDASGNLVTLLDEGGGALYQKWSGTSIAAAQVTGILALALESYPNMNQAEAKEYVLNYAKEGLMSETFNGFGDPTSLQDGPNRIVFYYKERKDDGVMIPKSTERIRPSTGQLYPRPKIRKT